VPAESGSYSQVYNNAFELDYYGRTNEMGGLLLEDFKLGLTPVFDIVAGDGAAAFEEFRGATANGILHLRRVASGRLCSCFYHGRTSPVFRGSL